jgi:filamentous hemagglutinin family protein
MAHVEVIVAGFFAVGLTCLSANPTGGQVASGSASITTVPGTVTVNQGSNIAIINWQTFSIGAGELTKFIQPSSTSAALNRVLGGQTSIIDGTLSANGQIYLINGNGILVGPGGVVNVNSFTASTRDIADNDFLSGNLHFTGSNSSGVQNLGTINALGGDVYLIGKTVDNEGTINAVNGTAGLAAADDVILNLGGEQHVFVSPSSTASAASSQTAVNNSGTIAATNAELKAANGNLYALAINNGGTIRATGVTQAGGHVYLTTDTGSIQNTGTVSAQSGTNGGQVSIAGGSVWNQQSIDASGAQGGSVTINSQNVENDGTISVKGTQGAGGSVAVTYSGNALGDVNGLIDASGVTQGGSIQFQGTGTSSEAYLSLALKANGTNGAGGSIDIDTPTLYLTGATLTANGATQGGRVFLGEGDPDSTSTLALAQSVYVTTGTTITANATSSGAGGEIGIASTAPPPQFFGTAEALGAGSGSNGRVDISGTTPSSGEASVAFVNGAAGNSSTSNANTATAENTTAAFEFVDPDPAAGNQFGHIIDNLATDNTLITSPGDSFGGAGAGAAYLFSDINGALLSTLRGSHAGDGVGTTVTLLYKGYSYTGNFLVEEANWNGGMGAVTFGSGTTGFIGGGGSVSASNSLVGSAAGDDVGSFGVTLLYTDGNYVVNSPDWNGGMGAVTWASGTTGVVGAVSASNSLVGANGGDHIGSSGITTLYNNDFLVVSPEFGGGAGAVTWASGTTGIKGVVGSGNSLVGTISTDAVGSGGVSILNNGDYVVLSPNWSTSDVGGVGAVTWGPEATGISGFVSGTNSLIGAAQNDHVGSAGVYSLLNGDNYLVFSPDWGGGAGAITNQPDSSQGVVGGVSAVNSLVGASTTDQVGLGGSSGIIDTYNGYYLVKTPKWGGVMEEVGAGAVTFNASSGGTVGQFCASNSLVGNVSSDAVGSGGIYILSGGDYVVLSPNWTRPAVPQLDFQAVADVGAVTWGSFEVGVSGAVSVTNSLTGGSQNDEVGSGGIYQLENDQNYLVLSPSWGGGAGAITDQPSNSVGTVGAVTELNSLVGASTSDGVGSSESITDESFYGYYLVTTSNWGGSEDEAGAGAITWNPASGGTVGQVGANNSLVGYASDNGVGSSGITILSNGNYVVDSPNLTITEDTTNGGAVTWGSASQGVSGEITASNSLVGFANDQIGSGGITTLNNGNYLVLSPQYGSGAGAVTFCSGTAATVGQVGASNSLVGSFASDGVGSSGDGYNGVTVLPNGNYVVDSPNWGDDQGAVTWGSGTTGVSGTVGPSNSLVGTIDSLDQIGSNGITVLDNGNYLVLSPQFGNGEGAVTFASGTAATIGTVGASNSLVGSQTSDAVGSGGVVALGDESYLVISPNWSNGEVSDVGAVTWGSGTTGVSGTISASNSLIGSSPNDQVGSGGIEELYDGADYLVLSPQWEGSAGAVTDGRDASGVKGVVSAANSLVGATTGDDIGSGGIIQLYNGNSYLNYLVLSPDWGGGKGAVTNGSDGTGAVGVVSASNSLVGASTSDHVGSEGSITQAYAYDDGIANAEQVSNSGGYDYYLVTTAAWGGNEGAVTWNSDSRGTVGVVSATNSLVGANAGDRIGSGETIILPGGNYLVQSPLYDSSAGAATWGSATSGVVGVVGPTNSIVGGGPNAGEEFIGYSADDAIYLIKFATDTSAGGNARVFAGSIYGPSSSNVPVSDLLTSQAGTTFSATGLTLPTILTEFFVLDPESLLLEPITSVDSPTDSAINHGKRKNEIASGSSTSGAPGPRRMITPGNGIWDIFGGLVRSGPPPGFVLQQIDLNLNPKVRVFLNQFLYINP